MPAVSCVIAFDPRVCLCTYNKNVKMCARLVNIYIDRKIHRRVQRQDVGRSDNKFCCETEGSRKVAKNQVCK